MLGDVGLIDYIDMQRDVLNRPRHSGIALVSAGATERRIAAVATFESAQLLVIKNTYIVPLHHTTSPYTSPSHILIPSIGIPYDFRFRILRSDFRMQNS